MLKPEERENELYRFQTRLEVVANSSSDIATSLRDTKPYSSFRALRASCLDLYERLEKEYKLFYDGLNPAQLRRAYGIIEFGMLDINDNYETIMRESKVLAALLSSRKTFGTRSSEMLITEIDLLKTRYGQLTEFATPHSTGEMTPARAIRGIRRAIVGA